MGMAVRRQAAKLREALLMVGDSRAVHVRLQLSGVPGVSRAAVFAWPEPLGAPRRLGVDVVALDDVALPNPQRFWVDVSDRGTVPREVFPIVVRPRDVEDPRPTEVRMPYVVWSLVDGAGLQPEVRHLRKDGQPDVAMVDTSVYSYRMTCPRCGRARYAKRNSLHQVHYCRPCTQADQKRRKATRQFQQRSRSLRGTPNTVQARVRALSKFCNLNYDNIARSTGVSTATVCRILKA